MVLNPWQCRVYRQECCLKGVGTGDAGTLSAGIQGSMTLLGWTQQSPQLPHLLLEWNLSFPERVRIVPRGEIFFYNKAKVAACSGGPSEGVYAMKQM